MINLVLAGFLGTLLGKGYAIFLSSLFFFFAGILLTIILGKRRRLADPERLQTEQVLKHMQQELHDLKQQRIENLKQGSENFTKIFNSNPVGIAISKSDTGVYVDVNQALLDILGYFPEDIIDRRSSELEIMEEKDLKEMASQVNLNGSIRNKELTIKGRDNNFKYCLVSLETVKLDGEDHLMSFVYDITERKSSEDRLNQGKKRLEILTDQLTNQNKQLLNFAHVISHNLRSPVGNLNLLLQFYQSSEDPEEKEVIWTNFKKVISHLNVTLDQLIESLKIQEDSGKTLELLSFEQILGNAKDILIGQIMETNAIIRGDFSKAPEFLYPKMYLESIMLNLISNALKYRSEDRRLQIELESSRNEQHVILKVKDNGIGIDLNLHKDKVFGLRQTFHPHAQAKGLGLFITKTQIEAMGGQISVSSEPGKGTEFTIFFNR